MKSLIKWPGGKHREYKHVKPFIKKSDYQRYVEPFFGGGAIFFNETPQEAVINDISDNLMNFYEMIKVQDDSFKYYMTSFKEMWTEINFLYEEMLKDIYDLFINFRKDSIHKEEMKKSVQEMISEIRPYIKSKFKQDVILDYEGLYHELIRNISNKISRMKRNEKKKGENLCDDDIEDNIETGIRSGFYMHYRNVYNDIELNRNSYEKLSKGYKASVFYFIREFCYGSMFRYNSRGEFNIPYGGISYNYKDFDKKVDKILSNSVKNIFNDTEIYAKDFEKFLNEINLNEDDFIFLDPPYDTTFSAYEDRSFDQTDQERLADYLSGTKADFLLIIKNTDFIFDLYSDRENMNLYMFDKKYCYNVKSRNDRDVKHLLITNMDQNQPKKKALPF